MIEIITGPMFSGKSEELLRRIKRCTLANQVVEVYSRDTRFGSGTLKSRSGQSIPCNPLSSLSDINPCPDTQVIAIDEVQFLGDEIVPFCVELSKKYRLILSGLDTDYLYQPFDNVARLMALAERVTKLTAVCSCGVREATRTFRKTPSNIRFLEGDAEYTCLCPICYEEAFNGKR